MLISPFLSHHTASPAVSGGLCPSHPWAVSTDGAPGPRYVCGPGCGRLKFPLATHVPNTCTDHLFHPLVPKAVLNASHRRFFLDCHASPERVERESSSPLSEVQEGLPPRREVSVWTRGSGFLLHSVQPLLWESRVSEAELSSRDGQTPPVSLRASSSHFQTFCVPRVWC